MRRKKIFVRPHLNNRTGDVKKRWYVELAQRNPKNNEMCRVRFEYLEDIKINIHQTAGERNEAAQKIIARLNAKIDSGWSIFEDTEKYIYEDQLQYSHAASVYKEKLSENNSYPVLIGKYINEFVSDLKAETNTTYTSRYRIFGLWLRSRNMYDLDITAITNEIIIAFFTYLKTDKAQGGRGMAARTYRSYADLLRAFFDDLVKKGLIEKSPIFNLPRNRTVKDMGAERIHEDDLTMLMKTLDERDPQLAMACRFEYYCGLRPGYEVRLLRVGDIDFRRGLSKVRIILDNAKTTRRRKVAIPDVFLDYLLAQGIDTYADDWYIFSKHGKPGTIRLGKNNFRYRFIKFRDELK
ncbi:MAG: phage integrase SAM-like domain-containing protein, partial [Bacteroidales bacterium]|nr:phage integrase SAM-like domain-containing protein [Bacteroidales bacterium]